MTKRDSSSKMLIIHFENTPKRNFDIEMDWVKLNEINKKLKERDDKDDK